MPCQYSPADMNRPGICKWGRSPSLSCCCTLAPIGPPLAAAGVLFATAPVLSNTPLLGHLFGLDGRCTAMLVVSTSLAFFPISAVLAA